MGPARRILLYAFWVVVVCVLGDPAVAQAQQDVARTAPERRVRTVFNHSVTLPPRDPRRVTLRDLEPGTVILVEVLPASAEVPSAAAEMRVEILRRTRFNSRDARVSAFESVHLQRGVTSDPIRYPVEEKGDYLVAIQWDGDSAPGTTIRLLVQVDQAVKRSPKPPVYTLPTDTRIAVAVFSAGLLWTTLLLCGVPIIRAFRSRRRNAAPPWFS